MGSADYKQAIRPDTAYLKKLIENSLLFDWVVRIEYENAAPDSNDWLQWDQAFFALRSAETVITALKQCYAKHANVAIRISAEKVRPQSRMVFTAYNPHYLADEKQDAVADTTFVTKRAYAASQSGMLTQN